MVTAQERRTLDYDMGNLGPATHEERVATVASAIRAAEDEALERAARHLTDKCFGSWDVRSVAAEVRALKSTPGSER